MRTEELLGIITGDLGVSKDGSRTENYQSGIEIRGKIYIIGRGM